MIDREKFIAFLQQRKTRFWPAAPGRLNNRPAAIMTPIMDDGSWTVIMTLRKRNLKDHGGEMCFPGGKPSDTDRDLKDTAIRETEEEVGLKNGLVIGRLSSVPLYTSDYRLEPFVGLYPKQKTSLSLNEVECIISLSLDRLLSLESIGGVKFKWPGFGSFISPVFLPHEIVSDAPTKTPIYGGTAHVLWELLEIYAAVSDRKLPRLTADLTGFPQQF